MTSDVVRITLIFALQRHEHAVSVSSASSHLTTTLRSERASSSTAPATSVARRAARSEWIGPSGLAVKTLNPAPRSEEHSTELRGDVCLERDAAADLAHRARARVELDRAGDVGRAQPGANGTGSAHQVWP